MKLYWLTPPNAVELDIHSFVFVFFWTEPSLEKQKPEKKRIEKSEAHAKKGWGRELLNSPRITIEKTGTTRAKTLNIALTQPH